MPTKVSSAVRRSTEEDVSNENASPARILNKERNRGSEHLQVRLGRLLEGLASRAALSPERAAYILARVRNPARR